MIAHEVWGDGPLPLVVLHGFTGSRDTFEHLRPHWERRCRVLALDLPGHGETPLSTAPSFRGALDAVLEVVEREGFAGGNLLGYSLGARVALGLAVHSPSTWTRLILESGSPGLSRKKARAGRRREDEQLASSIELKGVESFVRRWEALPLFSGLEALPPPERDRLRARRLSGTVEGFAGSLRRLGLGSQPNFWPALPHLRLPTLLLTGERDVKFTETARRMAAELPMAWRRTFPDVGHAPHLEVPADYAAEVLAFLGTPWTEAEVPVVEQEGQP